MKPSKIPAVTAPTPGEFNGHPVLTLPNPDDPAQSGIQFGIKKLRAMLANVEPCRAFVAQHYKPKAADPEAEKRVAEAEAKAAKVLALASKLSGLDAAAIESELARAE